MQFFIKTIISAVVISIVSVVSKKLPFLGAMIVSIPITSMLAIVWLYNDTHSTQKVMELSNSICLMVIPSIIFFIALSLSLKHNLNIYRSLALSCVVMIISYTLYAVVLKKFGITI